MGRGSHTESFAHARRPLSACRTLVSPVGLPIKTEEGLQLAQDAPPCGVGALYATDTTHSVDQGNQFPSVFLHRKDETTCLWLIRSGQLTLRKLSQVHEEHVLALVTHQDLIVRRQGRNGGPRVDSGDVTAAVHA